MQKLIEFVKESFDELRHKVTWPKYSDLQSSSILVLIGTLIFSLVIGVMDFGFDNLMKIYYDTF